MNMVKTKKATKPTKRGNKPRLLKRGKPLFPGEIMTIDEICKFLRLSKKAVYHLVQKGKIPALKAGSKYRFYLKAVLEAMGKYQNKPEEREIETQKGQAKGAKK